jgi:hypothetical protein
MQKFRTFQMVTTNQALSSVKNNNIKLPAGSEVIVRRFVTGGVFNHYEVFEIEDYDQERPFQAQTHQLVESYVKGNSAMRVYLAGPMAGYPENNYPAFHRGAAWLRSKGYEVVSPAEINFDAPKRYKELESKFTGDELSLEKQSIVNECLKKDFVELLSCELIVKMKGWQESTGVNKEIDLGNFVAIGSVELSEIMMITDGVVT